LQRRISDRAIVQRELQARVEGLIGSPVDPLGPRHAFLVACIASGEHERTEEITRAEMAVIDAAFWVSMCSSEPEAKEAVTNAERAAAEAAHWKSLCSAEQLGPAAQSSPTVPSSDPELRLRGHDNGTDDDEATGEPLPPPAFEHEESGWNANGVGDAFEAQFGQAVDNSHAATVDPFPPSLGGHEIHDCDDVGDAYWNSIGVRTAGPSPASVDVGGPDDPAPTIGADEGEATCADGRTGRLRAAALAALDRNATVSLGMGSKPVHQYCESCKAVARENPDGLCPACGAVLEVGTAPLTWNEVASTEGSESWSDEEISVEILTDPDASSNSPPPSEAGSDEDGGGLFEDSTAFFAEVLNRTGHARYQEAARRLVAPPSKTAPPVAAGPMATKPPEASAKAPTLCSQTVGSLTDFPRHLLTRLLEFGGGLCLGTTYRS
jgi:hypothetical protein